MWCKAGLLVALMVSLVRPSVASADEIVLNLDPAASSVDFRLDAFLHTVDGKFPFASGTLRFDPVSGRAGGEIVVNLAAGTTGLGPRDAVMRGRVLETSRFPEATFTPQTVTGTFNPAGASTLAVGGVLVLHGVPHQWTFQAAVTAQGDRVAVTSRSTIPYVAWGLHDPSTFLLHVKDRVDVTIQAVGRLAPA